MLYAEVPMVGPYRVTVAGTTTTAPGPTDALGDYSTSTWVDVDQYIGPTGVFLNTVAAELRKGGTTVTPKPILGVYARILGGPILGVSVLTAGAGSSSAMVEGAAPIESPLGTLYRMDSGGLGQVNNAIAGFSVTMQVSVPADRTNHTVSRIYEAGLVVRLLSSDAPPCRILQRSDGLGLGAGRAYPPAKSQQRSPGNRGVGYY